MSYTLHLGDCIEGMKALADKSVDHVICDPPYSRDLYTRMRTNKGTGLRPNGKPVCKSAREGGKGSREMASLAIGAVDDILEATAAECQRLAQRWVIVFCDIEIANLWRDALGDWYVRTGVWVKTDPMPQITGDRPAQGFEPCVIAHRPGRKKWNGGGRPASWIGGTCKGDERPDHPCPKPEWLMERLVADFTDPGDLILDPFAGSGTTGVAAIRLGRRFIGFERDPKYHAVALKRLAVTREQLGLFREGA